MGQFGNQLFEIAAVLGYAKRFGCKPVLPKWFCEVGNRDYGALFPGANKFVEEMKGIEVNVEQCAYEPVPFVYDADLLGFFQSEKNFEEAKEEVRQLFSEPESITKVLDEYCREHSLSKFNAVHFRFYTHQNDDYGRNVTHLPLPDWYYVSAIDRLRSDLPIVVATDDKVFLKRFFDRTGVSGKFHFLTFDDSLLDFFMLSRAQGIAISNSSFSWWAAYLSNAKQVYAPPYTIWFAGPRALLPSMNMRDLYPLRYTQITDSPSRRDS